MRRLLAVLVAVLMWGVSALAFDFNSFPNFPSRAGSGSSFDKAPWWYNGHLTFYAPFDNPSDPLRLIKGTGSLSFTRATTATYVHPTTGLITSAASGQLRIESNGALIEGARTNLALQSEALGLAATWIASNMTVDNNTAVAPDGATTAETLTATSDNATLLQAVTGTEAAYSNSLYLKRKTGTGAVQVSADNTTWTSCTINASTWTRCSDTRTLTVATYYHGVRLAASGDAVYAFGGDMELGGFPSSYTATTTVAVVRNADVLTFPITGNLGNTAGSFSAEINRVFSPQTRRTVLGGASIRNIYVLSDAHAAIYDGANQILKVEPAPLDGKWSGSWAGSGMAITVNGLAVGAGAFDGDLAVPDPAYIGTGVGDYLFGHIKNLRIWNRAFSNAELQSITQ